MTTKGTKKKPGGGMKAFAAGASSARRAGPKPAPAAEGPAKRGRPKQFDDARHPLTIRLSREQYRLIRQLAFDIGTTVQDLAVAGFSKVLVEHGLDPL